MKRSLLFLVRTRRVLGVAVIIGIVAVAIGWDTNSFPRLSFVNTAKAEEHAGHSTGAFDPEKPAVLTASVAESRPAVVPVLGDEGSLPDLGGAVAWLNSAPLSSKSLRGKVVLVNFWTYSCINSLRELPYMNTPKYLFVNVVLVVTMKAFRQEILSMIGLWLQSTRIGNRIHSKPRWRKPRKYEPGETPARSTSALSTTM